jgi:hypothetical protein
MIDSPIRCRKWNESDEEEKRERRREKVKNENNNGALDQFLDRFDLRMVFLFPAPPVPGIRSAN